MILMTMKWGKRHQLALINIFDDEAKINSNAPEAYKGLDRFVARKQIIKDLTEQELLVKIEPHALKIPRNDRGGAVIEPYLMDQWYVNMKAMSSDALKAAANKDLTFIPENWINTYNEWLENIQDWCISRQLWWGHRIPVWYDENKNTYVGEDEANVREKYELAANIKLTQDEDVLDTWFSSALWPFSTLGWPNTNSEMLKTFYPTQVLVTGFDIIFFWVARMVMFGLKFMEDVPFEKVYITGLIRDQDGQKMSKTKGNVLDPIDLIDGISLPDLIKKRTSGMMQERLVEKVIKATEKQFPEGIAPHGTDAVRFTFAALASHSRDINFDVKRLEGYRNFCNKLWNAARFVMMNVEGKKIAKQEPRHPINKWMLQQLHAVIVQNETYNLENYRFDMLAQDLYELVWNVYCDWYLELSKNLIQNEATQAETAYVLLHVLETMLRALHPIIPFVTETIWQEIKPLLNLSEEFILDRPYPSEQEMHDFFAGDAFGYPDDSEEHHINQLQRTIINIRTFRSENKISPSKVIKMLFATEGVKEFHGQYLEIINQLARVDLQRVAQGAALPANLRLDVGDQTYYVPLADFIDVEAELKRVHKELASIDANITSVETKLGNPSFVDKAPPAVIEKERERLNEQKSLKEKLLIKVSELQRLA